MLRCVKSRWYFFIVYALTFFSNNISAQTQCKNGGIDNNQILYFYNQLLGTYDINLNITLTAIKNHQTTSGFPYTEKKWRGICPGGLEGSYNTCLEYTVYPNDENFFPSGIMEKIKKYNHNNPNRGEVRVITDSTATHYVYTTDHEATFCGPYNL